MSNTGPWNYIIVFSDSVGKKDDVKEYIDSRSEFTNWYICMSNAIFVRSKCDAKGITTILREFTEDEGRFIVLDVDTDKSGWLPKKAWSFMKGE